MIQRALSGKIRRWLTQFPAIGLLGPRQCGKSTLAKQLLENIPQSIYLDLKPEHAWIIAPVEAAYPIRRDVTVTSLAALLEQLGGQS